jgi:hypothetical protein
MPMRAQPTKPKIQLKSKVKPLQWTRVLLLPKQSPNRPDLVWNNLTEYDFDMDDIISRFEIKKTTTSQTSTKQSVPQKKRFLDDKRTQSVGIIIVKLPIIQQVQEALSTMNPSLMSKTQIESLHKEFITKEEYDTYISMGEDGEWDKGEKYLIEANAIPNAKLKLSIWSTILDFIEHYPGIEESFAYMQDACKEIKENIHLKNVLSVILTIGNILNGGTQKGQADGFSLDLLPKLASIKDNNNKSVLYWVCLTVKKNDPNFDGLKSYFPKLIKASEYSFNESMKNLNDLKRSVSNIDKSLNSIKEEDDFIKKGNEYLQEFKNKIEHLEKKSSDNMKIYQDTVKYFGYTEKDSKYKAPEEFFRMLLLFFDEIEKANPKTELKKRFKIKNEKGLKIDQSACLDKILKK